jgi:multidrug resistance efflux pump
MKFDFKSTKRQKRILSVCIVALPVFIFVAWERLVDIRFKPITVTGTIQAKEIAVASKIGGRIASLNVKEGQDVKPGETILEFEVPEMEAKEQQLMRLVENRSAELLELKNGPRPSEIAEAAAACRQALAQYTLMKNGYRKEEIERAVDLVEEARANLDLLLRGYRKEDIFRAKAVMDEARIRADWFKRDSQRYDRLAQDGAISKRDAEDLQIRSSTALEVYLAAKQEYEKMLKGPRPEEITAAKEHLKSTEAQRLLVERGYRVEEIEAARQAYLSKKARFDLLQEGTRKERIMQAEAAVKQVKAELKEVQALLKDRKIVSPAPAEVSVMDLHPGELIPANKSVITLTRLDDVWTRVYIPARELARVSMGMEVQVKVDSFPGRVFKGRIVQIPSIAEFTPRNVQTAEERSAQVFGLKVQIDNPDQVLRGGMNTEIVVPPVVGSFFRLADNGHRKSNYIR